MTIENLADDIAAVGRIEAVTRILDVICRTTGLGFSAVARVTESRWIACAVRDEIAFGLEPGGELVLDTTICDEIRRSGELVVIEDTDADDRYECHPTPKRYGFRSYISVPILLADGRFFGTLCAIDPRPAQLKKPETIEMFRLFASLIAFHLDAQLELVAGERSLDVERESSRLRERFIAVLGHELRTPLSAIGMASKLLAGAIADPDDLALCGMIDRSVVRMAELIENALDLARGRLGIGLSVFRSADAGLEGVLDQVIRELESAWPGRAIHRAIAIDRPVFCDGARLAQLASNLLGNALVHGDRGSPVRVDARTTAEAFELAVANRGETIPPEIAAHLFEPFVRGPSGPRSDPDSDGLGLGLYIASEIARAHGGTLEVSSASGETRFTFRMPLDDR